MIYWIYPQRHHRDTHPRKENNCGDESSMVLLYDKHLCDTIIAGNTDLTSNNIPEYRYSVLPSLHISGAKYRIFSGKADNAKNITIQKIMERIGSNNILEVTDDKGVIHLLINLKFILIVLEYGSPFQNVPHYTSLVFCETNVRDKQYKTKDDTVHYP